MDKWNKYFSIVGYQRFIFPGVGEINSRDPKLSLEKVKKAYEKGCEFIIPTNEGIERFYPDLKKIEPKKVSITRKKKATPKKPAK